MRFFLAGIMQGSHHASAMHDQDYRDRLKRILAQHIDSAEIYDPLADNKESIDYDDQLGREVFFRHNRMCREVECVLAFLPEASMGTAIEMWEAHRHGRAVIAISPMKLNWAVKFCSHAIYPDLASFEAALAGGEVEQRIYEVLLS